MYRAMFFGRSWAICLILWGVLDEGREVYGQRQSLRIEGVYQGENLFIQNPLDEKGSFCIHDIQINGEEVLHEPKRSAIALDFTSYSLQTVLRVLITHRAGCVPLCLNAEVLRMGGGFAFTQVLLREDTLCFSVKGEAMGSAYAIERIYGEEWSLLMRILSKGASTYCVLPTWVEGHNKLRICYESGSLRRCSSGIEHIYQPPIITFFPEVVTDKMTLSNFAHFEILNEFGELILEGKGKVISLRLLKAGDYFIVLEDQEYPFVKK